MHRILAAVIAIGLLAASAPARADGDRVTVDRDHVERVLDHALRQLSRLEILAQRCQDRACARIDRSLVRLQMRLGRLRDEVAMVPGAPAAPPAPPAPQAISHAHLEDLLGQMGHEPFAKGKLRVLGSAAAWAYFTTNQVVAILRRFTFGHDKLAALRLLAPRIIDPENGYHVYGAFTFDSDKAAARRILQSGASH